MSKRKQIDVYVTRDSALYYVYVFPAKVGIRKFHGCVTWGAAWNESVDTVFLTARRNSKLAEGLGEAAFRNRFGFYPRPGTAWLIEYTPKGKMKKPKKVDLAFSD